MQTQLDSLILDNTRAWTLFTIWTLSILSIAVFFGPTRFEFAYALIVILTITVNLTLAAFTVTVIVKGVLVFKPDWFDEMDDEKVQKMSRFTMIIYSTIIQLINTVCWSWVGGIRSPLLKLLTKEDDQLIIFAPGFGSLLGVLILVILLAIFETKRPAMENEKKFKGAVFTGLAACIGIFINTLLYQLIADENLTLLNACMLEILIGIVQPCLYISGKDNLKAYTLNMVDIKIVEPIRKLKFLRGPASNQVGNLPV